VLRAATPALLLNFRVGLQLGQPCEPTWQDLNSPWTPNETAAAVLAPASCGYPARAPQESQGGGLDITFAGGMAPGELLAVGALPVVAEATEGELLEPRTPVSHDHRRFCLGGRTFSPVISTGGVGGWA
jgi:hypothetical protein